MRTVRLALALLGLAAARGALAQTCGPTPVLGTYWTATYVYTTASYDSTFTLTAPCKVLIDTEFIVTARVHANDWAYNGDRNVGNLWELTDWPQGATTITTLSGTFISTSGGDWVRTVATTYRGTPVNHVIGFWFMPGSVMNMVPGQLLSALTVDPYPDPSTSPPSPSPATAEVPGASSGGCSSAGGLAALGLLGAFALRRTRRR